MIFSSMSPDPASDAVDTVSLASTYCPSCDPNRDPLREILTVHWCDEHRPPSDGADDRRTTLGRRGLSAMSDAEADTNRLWCDLLHRTLNSKGRKPADRQPGDTAE